MWFQQMVRADGAEDPRNDPRVQRSVRFLGLLLVGVSALLLAVGLAMWTSR